jgi:hypothetical protein
MLLDCYNWLSDFAHPNFLSNASSFSPDKTNRRFVFRHEGDIQESDFQLMVYLEMSAMLFVRIFHYYLRLMTENGLGQ